MGTRNLTAVMSDGEYKVAQYGQWDGDPSGQGADALAFCQEYLTTAAGREAFKAKLANVSFFDGEPPEEEAEKYRRYWTRDNGAKILGLIMEAKAKTIKLTNQIDFAGESLFCEWAYVVDLDKGTFEVFKGFNKHPLPETERFANAKRDSKSTEYFPVKHVVSFTLEALPTKRAFLSQFKYEDDEESDNEENDGEESEA